MRSQELIYGIETRDVDKVGLRVDEAGIIVVLPQAMANDWTGSERVGVYEEIVYPAGCRVSVLIEKEFRRMHGGTNDPDLYPNPLETA